MIKVFNIPVKGMVEQMFRIDEDLMKKHLMN